MALTEIKWHEIHANITEVKTKDGKVFRRPKDVVLTLTPAEAQMLAEVTGRVYVNANTPMVNAAARVYSRLSRKGYHKDYYAAEGIIKFREDA